MSQKYSPDLNVPHATQNTNSINGQRYKEFWCEDSNLSVLMQHLTFVIFGLRHIIPKQIMNLESGKNPMFVSPMTLYFTKDEGAFG